MVAIDPLAKVTVSREGIFELSDETVVDEINIFKGSENKIAFDKVYTNTFMNFGFILLTHKSALWTWRLENMRGI